MNSSRLTRKFSFRVAATWIVGVIYVGMFVALAVRSHYWPVYDFDNSFLIIGVSWVGAGAVLLWWRRIITRIHYLLPLALILVAFVSHPDTSKDPFRFLFDGEIIRIWQLSPYTSLPQALPVDQYSTVFHQTWWTAIPSPYGPLWQAQMLAINWLSDNQLFGGMVLLKLVNIAALLGCARYVYLITGKSWMSYGLLINPLLLVNTAHTPHPDIVIALALLATYYHSNVMGRGFLLGGAGLIKFHGLIFAPFFVRKRREILKLALGTAAALAVMLLVLKPIVGFDWLPMLEAGKYGGLYGTYSLLFFNALPGASRQLVFAASYGLFVALYVGLVVVYLRGKLSSLGALTLTSLLVPLILTGLLFPWHFLIPLAFLALTDKRAAMAATLFITIFSFRAPVNVLVFVLLAGILVAGAYVARWAFRRLSSPPKIIWETKSKIAGAYRKAA